VKKKLYTDINISLEKDNSDQKSNTY